MAENNGHQEVDRIKAHVDRGIVLNPGLPPPEAAANEITSEILDPLVKFGSSLGLTQDQEDAIRLYAQKAADLTKKETEAQLTENPLFQIDSLIAKRMDVLRKEKKDFQRDEEWQHLAIARNDLRKTQTGFKQVIEESIHVGEIVTNNKDEAKAQVLDNFRDIYEKEVSAGKIIWHNPVDLGKEVMPLILTPEELARIKAKENDVKKSGSKTEFDNLRLQIGDKGIKASVGYDARYANVWETFTISFDYGSILRIYRSTDLPVLSNLFIQKFPWA